MLFLLKETILRLNKKCFVKDI